MNEVSTIPVLPGPIWISGLALVVLYVTLQLWTNHNKRIGKREASWEQYANENRELRSELGKQSARIGEMQEEMFRMREEFNNKLDQLSDKLDAAGRVLAEVATQNPNWKPALDPYDVELLEDTLPRQWHPTNNWRKDGNQNHV